MIHNPIPRPTGYLQDVEARTIERIRQDCREMNLSPGEVAEILDFRTRNPGEFEELWYGHYGDRP